MSGGNAGGRAGRRHGPEAAPARPEPPSAERGEAVYAANCVRCHGADGQGNRKAPPGIGWAIPPLWGDGSFNDAAGMSHIETAAAFIRANMPRGVSYEAPMLTDAGGVGRGGLRHRAAAAEGPAAGRELTCAEAAARVAGRGLSARSRSWRRRGSGRAGRCRARSAGSRRSATTSAWSISLFGRSTVTASPFHMAIGRSLRTTL